MVFAHAHTHTHTHTHSLTHSTSPLIHRDYNLRLTLQSTQLYLISHNDKQTGLYLHKHYCLYTHIHYTVSHTLHNLLTHTHTIHTYSLLTHTIHTYSLLTHTHTTPSHTTQSRLTHYTVLTHTTKFLLTNYTVSTHTQTQRTFSSSSRFLIDSSAGAQLRVSVISLGSLQPCNTHTHTQYVSQLIHTSDLNTLMHSQKHTTMS